MDTVVVIPSVPFMLTFDDIGPDELRRLWRTWITEDRMVTIRSLIPGKDAVIELRPAATSLVQFIPNEPGVRGWGERGLWTDPTLYSRDEIDAAPEDQHYWSLQPRGASATVVTTTTGETEIHLDVPDPARY